MEAIVLAGGFGTRLRAVVADLPKPMAPVAGRPFLEILLASLAGKGITRVVLSVGYMAQTIVERFGHTFGGLEIDYAIEATPLGTGGAVRLALGRCTGEPVLVVNGDTFLDVDLEALRGLWRADRAPVVVARAVGDTTRFGRLRVEGERITAFAEKGVAGPGLINAGCYLVPRDLLAAFGPDRAFSLETDFLAPCVERSTVRVLVSAGTFIDIGVPEDYARAQTLLAPHAAPR
jgi:D-glycero-alpha-D-manno-heptose 1-phosphate guanylyltransferase